MRSGCWCIAALAAALALTPPAAVASDASVRAAVRSAENDLAPASRAFNRAIKRFAKTGRAAPVRAAIKRGITVIDLSRPRVVRERATSKKVRRGKALFLSMLAELRGGLAMFDDGLRQLQSGHRSDATDTIDEATSQVSSVGSDEARALKLLGVT